MHAVFLSRFFSARSGIFFILFFYGIVLCEAQPYNRGAGIYPGDPKDIFSPGMRIDSLHYRNIALRRPAYQSGAYDYNLTAQLITDGLTDTKLPGWLVVMTSN